MAAKKKVTPKESKEKKATPEVKKKMVVEEVASQEESAQTDSKEMPVSSEEQNLSSETEKTSSEKPLEEEIPLEKTNRKLFTAGLIVVLFIFGVTGWVFYFTNRCSQETTQEEITLEGITEEPTATPVPAQLEREEITLEILNGSGVAGAAGDAAEVFEALGYEIVEIGNAESTEGNQLYVNPEAEELIEILLEDVENELDISSVSGELADSTASARIILGE